MRRLPKAGDASTGTRLVPALKVSTSLHVNVCWNSKGGGLGFVQGEGFSVQWVPGSVQGGVFKGRCLEGGVFRGCLEGGAFRRGGCSGEVFREGVFRVREGAFLGGSRGKRGVRGVAKEECGVLWGD